ncbi:phage tail protein, P2 protein I family [Persephonella hydrogeniphila]|uniref:Phage tail protein, P2 protein I family n=1 Tax=Persephonella hydrogeniphila TaxID=198703 RepID=A0A285NMK5_9AQUI|nr:phage tail protein I [Persephonella hydrogeniphila]SNZ10730.1 phage tail protein, P2 protein I family [Persephonella hydrogeniphila]
MSEKLLPDILRKDKRLEAFAELEGKSFEQVSAKIPYLLIYKLENLSDSELEELAWQFDISQTEWELATDRKQKEELIKNNILLKAKRGTKWAIKKVLDLLGLQGQISEWFDYGGQPYRFKVDIDLKYQGFQSDTYDKLFNLIKEYKNVRSHLDSLNIYLTSNLKQNRALLLLSGHDITIYPYQVKELQLSAKDYTAIGYQAVHTTTIYPATN